jgi:hypothetical protein
MHDNGVNIYFSYSQWLKKKKLQLLILLNFKAIIGVIKEVLKPIVPIFNFQKLLGGQFRAYFCCTSSMSAKEKFNFSLGK